MESGVGKALSIERKAGSGIPNLSFVLGLRSKCLLRVTSDICIDALNFPYLVCS